MSRGSRRRRKPRKYKADLECPKFLIYTVLNLVKGIHLKYLKSAIVPEQHININKAEVSIPENRRI